MPRRLPLGLLLAAALFSSVVVVAADRVPPADDIVADARERAPGAVARYCDALRNGGAEPFAGDDAAGSARDALLRDDLAALAGLVLEAERAADAALAAKGYDKRHFHRLLAQAAARDHDCHSLAVEAADLIVRAWERADALVKTREAVFTQYQDELRRGEVADGTRLAWSLIRIGAAHPDTRVVSGSFRYDADSAEIRLVHLGSDVAVRLEGGDLRTRFRAVVDGYAFRAGWSVLFQKPLNWMATLAQDMARAGVPADLHPEWEAAEAPGGVIALAGTAGEDPVQAFYRGALRDVTVLPPPAGSGDMMAEFLAAAKALHEGVAGDESIARPLRAALTPILKGAYLPIDSRDYFDADFCRRLLEADYLESHIDPLPAARAAELARYREALAQVEAGVDRFAVDCGEDGRLVAVARPAFGEGDGLAARREPETGETAFPHQWRWEGGGAAETAFHAPLPGRQFHAMSVVDRFAGAHTVRPRGEPEVTEVWHAVLGKVAEYRRGADAAEADDGRWLEAVRLDTRGRRDGSSGPLGWNFPPYVPVLDDQADPVRIATPKGVVAGPDFAAYADPAARRAAQDAWLDHAAAVLATPGEMALLYKIFFRYCSDSPLPERPNLIGSHLGLSDTHQTVYESLDRRWVGRLIGDCDDLAEFFQELAERQGRLAHVMQLPAHAAAGWLEEDPDGGFAFVVLQTGPVLRFVDATRVGAVEKAYRHFDDDTGSSQFTAAAVPLLLRFADEETRTPFVLSARIYWDREYAESMIRVQEYWHLHTYAAAVEVMEAMVAGDREIGNLKELASLYERVARHDEADAMRREELDAVGDDVQAALSTRLDLAQLHARIRDTAGAMAELEAMEAAFRAMREDAPADYKRTAPFRYAWAAQLARLGEPERAWALLRHDALTANGTLPEPLLRTLTGVYEAMAALRDDDTAGRSPQGERVRREVRETLERAFGSGYFKADDSLNRIHARYFWLGRYGVAVAGRRDGLAALWLDGPYPDTDRDHAARTVDLDEADWEWFRLMPRLYLAYGLEMLDKQDHPDRYDPVAARRCLERVARARERGAALGADVMGRDAETRAALVLSILDRDLAAFEALMAEVLDKNYASLYDDAATAFGMYCGAVPLGEFPRWVEAFRRYFPGRQQYFKAAYRAMDKGHLDHADHMADAIARFFPEDTLLVREAAALREATERLREAGLGVRWGVEWAGAGGDVLGLGEAM